MNLKLKLMGHIPVRTNIRVTIMEDSIKEECRKRGFTLNEFEQLANLLLCDAQKKRDEIFQSALPLSRISPKAVQKRF